MRQQESNTFLFFHIITAQPSCANNILFLGVYKGFEASQTPPQTQSQTEGGGPFSRYNEEKKIFQKKERENKRDTEKLRCHSVLPQRVLQK